MAVSLEPPKLVFRHALCRLGLLDADIALRLPEDRIVRRSPGQSLGDVFSQIDARGLWVEAKDQDSLSGPARRTAPRRISSANSPPS